MVPAAGFEHALASVLNRLPLPLGYAGLFPPIRAANVARPDLYVEVRIHPNSQHPKSAVERAQLQGRYVCNATARCGGIPMRSDVSVLLVDDYGPIVYVLRRLLS